MKKFSYFAVIGHFCCITISANSQTLSALASAPKRFSGKFSTTFVEVPADKARKKIIEHLQKKVKRLESIETQQGETINNDQFNSYLNQFQGIYVRERVAIEKSGLSKLEKMVSNSNLEKTFSIALSGKCFSEKKEGTFVLTQDTDGQEIATIWVETERQNPRYALIDDYQQGFARIKKDGVYGFWDLCGSEVITPQYEYADRFNDGKALVKKFNWHFVSVNGNESEPLLNVVDAHAVKYGVSIAKLKNGNSVLIDNNYDVSQKPLSEEFAEILPLNSDYLLVKEGKKYGILSLTGETYANVIYDKITIGKDGKFLFEKDKKVIQKN